MRGRTANIPKWTVGGACAGAGLGLGVVALRTFCWEHNCGADNAFSFKNAAIVGAALGAVGGFAIARFAVRRGPHWEEIDKPRVRLNVIPVSGRGVGLAVSLAF
jgi:hypothetical protein